MGTKQFIVQKFVSLSGIKPQDSREDLITVESSIGTLVLVNVYLIVQSSILDLTAPHLATHSQSYEPVTPTEIDSVTYDQLKDTK